MTLLNVANVSWVALLAAMAGTASNACSNNAGPPPKAFVAGTIDSGTETGVNDPPQCGMNSALTWQLGSPITGQPTEFSDGSNQNGGAVHIFCSVDQQGGAFSVNLSAELDGMMAGTIQVSGTVQASGMSSGLTGAFSTGGQQFLDHNCTFTQTYNGQPLPSGGAPAGGRIWGHIDCPHATESGQQGANGNARECEAQADFRFENCN